MRLRTKNTMGNHIPSINSEKTSASITNTIDKITNRIHNDMNDTTALLIIAIITIFISICIVTITRIIVIRIYANIHVVSIASFVIFTSMLLIIIVYRITIVITRTSIIITSSRMLPPLALPISLL